MISQLSNFPIATSIATEFPAYTDFLIEEKVVHLQYEERVGDHLVFKCSDENSGHKYAVKFVEKPYPIEVHDFAHSIGFAPKIVHFSFCVPRHWVIVMEWCEGKILQEKDIPRLTEQAKTFLTIFHENNYVHGDFRSDNWYVGVNGNLVIMDYDWSGLLGQAMYPPFMNPQVCWPSGADTGKLITPDHDLYWWTKIAAGDLNSWTLDIL